MGNHQAINAQLRHRRTRLCCLLALPLILMGCIATPGSRTSVAPSSTAQSTHQSPAPSPAPARATDANSALWEQLRQGRGYVVLLRHAQTVPGSGDPPGFELTDCATQRNLSAVGRTQAAQIGDAFERERIPIAQVLSSQYCRCLETAALMQVGAVEPAPLLNSIFEDRSTADSQIAQTQQRVSGHRSQPGVLLMVTHFANISAIAGVALAPGEAVVIQANDQGEISVVGRLQDL